MPQSDIRCRVCQTENPAGTRFCSNCGNLLEDNKRGGVVLQSPPAAGQPGRRSITPAALLAIGIVGLLGGCFWFLGRSHVGQPSKPWFRLHGSTTIGLTLAPRLAESFFHSKGATAIATTTVPGSVIHFLVQGLLPSEASPRTIEIEAQGSGSGFADLAHNSCEIGMSSREIKSAEIQTLAAFGDFTDRSSDRIVGLDGVAVIVNRENRLDEINLDDLARIFSGEYRAWNRLPTKGRGEIFVTARDSKSGTWETFRDLVLETHHREIMKLDDSQRFVDNTRLAATVASNVNAIGFVGMTYAKDVKTLRVGHPRLRALLPTRLTVLHEEYPLRRRLHLFVPTRGTNDAAALASAREFCEFALSHEGQSVVDAAGFVSEDASNSTESSQADQLPNGYPSIMQGSQRLYTLFFQAGSSTLEPLALDNIDRVSQLMTKPAYLSANVFLAGHADNTGGHQVNLEVSERRANKVRETLTDRGVHVELAIPLGEQFPIEPNILGKGNPRNRRVEVWIKKK